MLRQDSEFVSTDRHASNSAGGQALNGGGPVAPPARIGNVDIQQELNKLEDMLLDSPRLPLSRWTLVDEEQLLDQLDLLRIHLPSAFQDAKDIIRNKEEILLEAENYAQDIVEAAERRAAEILDEMGLIRQAEMEARQIRQQIQQECDVIHEQTMQEVEQLRRQIQQEVEEMRVMAIAECEEIQRGADDYADRVLRDMEQQMADMIRVIRNGRQQLQLDPPSGHPPHSAGEGRSHR